MSRTTDTTIYVSVHSTDPDLRELIDAVEASKPASMAETRAQAVLLTEIYHARLWDDGYRQGHDEGSAKFVDGPWWKRAWTAARS